jgi:Mg/Co/Ni transporter MgtE
MRLKTTNEGLHRLRPGELADLLEDLRRDERRELLAALSPDEAADALEEMQAEDLEQLLRESDPVEAARLLAAMEPDEAVDALRDLPLALRAEVLRHIPAKTALALRELLGYEEDEAGGIMTTTLVTAQSGEKVKKVADRLSESRAHGADLDAVAVVDGDGRLLGDVTVLDILLALRTSPDTRMSALLGDEDMVTVSPHASAGEVAGQLVEARRHSLVVVDDDGRPIGRILADDVLDALVPTKGRFHFPRLLS